jgi:hypothetical protein
MQQDGIRLVDGAQCEHDARENNIPSIMLHWQCRLYSQGRLAMEVLFRMAANGTYRSSASDTT